MFSYHLCYVSGFDGAGQERLETPGRQRYTKDENRGLSRCDAFPQTDDKSLASQNMTRESVARSTIRRGLITLPELICVQSIRLNQ